MVLKIKPRALNTLDKCSTAEPHSKAKNLHFQQARNVFIRQSDTLWWNCVASKEMPKLKLMVYRKNSETSRAVAYTVFRASRIKLQAASHGHSRPVPPTCSPDTLGVDIASAPHSIPPQLKFP